MTRQALLFLILLAHELGAGYCWVQWRVLARQLPPECTVEHFELPALEAEAQPYFTSPTSKGGPVEL